MLEVDGNTDPVEFSDYISQMEGKEISESWTLELQVNSFTTLCTNEPRYIDQIAISGFERVITIE